MEAQGRAGQELCRAKCHLHLALRPETCEGGSAIITSPLPLAFVVGPIEVAL